ncbi:MAG: polysaccharide biosynthesis tyrosine autokinase [Gammaproteobacteria bacterium]|nr:polysaccharide biosynthesis tyrosine autokinase [Gammaproteobacteria bacterium]
MSIFAKAFKKIKDKPEVQEKRVKNPEDQPSIPKIDIAERALITGGNKRPVHIDIPLNENLSESHGVVKREAKYKEVDIDFDFSNLFDDNTVYPESDVISINPVKSFSGQLEIDLDMLAGKGYVTPKTINTLLGNTFRMIKRPLLNNIAGKGATVVDNANIIMLTSSLDGEGKSFSAINLAISMAMEKDIHVLLIDADVNKPSHHEIFNYQSEFGLTDLLQGRVKDMSRVLHRTNIPSLTLMTAGSKTSHATELLASEAMEKFVREISSFYRDRIIIFDSPPLLLPTEASVLASHMGQVVFVIEAEKTLRHDIKKGLSMLSNRIVLLLLNQGREKTQVGNYGYYKYENQT